METDCDTWLSDNHCLICGSSPVNESSDDYDDGKILEIFLSCIDLTENLNDLSERTAGIKFCFKCKLKLDELDYVQSQIDELLLRVKQLKMGIITDAVQQSSVPSENSSARWIRRLIRNNMLNLSAPVTGEGEKSTEGMTSSVESAGIVLHSHCSSEPIKPSNHKTKPAAPVRTVQNLSPGTNSVASEPVTLREEVRQEATQEGHGSSYKFKRVRVTVINDKHTCEAKGCSKYFTGKCAPKNVLMHIRICHLKQPLFRLKDVTKVKPGEYLYRKKLRFTFKNGIIQCGLCPQVFLTDKNPAAAEDNIITHLKREHSDEGNKPTDRKKTRAGPAGSYQNRQAANTVVSQPTTLVGQGSPSVFHIQPYPLLQNGQTVYAVVPSSNPIQPSCITQPAISTPGGTAGQFNSVGSLHSAGCSVASDQPMLPRSFSP